MKTSSRRALASSLASFALSLSFGLARSASAAPSFVEVPNAFGPQPCAKAGCWTNYMRLADLDGDGSLDVVFPNAEGFFKKGGAEPLVVYFNDGKGHFADVSQATVMGFTGWVRQVAVGDVDGDGDLDLYAPAAWGDPDALFINDGEGHFKEEALARTGGLRSHAGAARFADVDGDGDLDLLIGDGWAQSSPSVAHLYLNDGKGNFNEALDALPTTKVGKQPIDFDLADVDGDFDLDLVIDMHEGKSSLWLNDGRGHFTDATASLPAQSNRKYDPVACDIDGDGDLDLIFDNAEGDMTEQLLINDGAGHFKDESAARIAGNVGADDNGVACVDVDGDGDFDLVVASLSDQERVFLNDGTGHFKLSPSAFPSVVDSTLWFDFGDLDGDGRIDCVTAQGESGDFQNRVYLGTTSIPVDTRPPAFRAVQTVAEVAGETAPVVRFAVTDEATTDDGPRLERAFVKVSGATGEREIDAVYSGGDLFQATLPAVVSGDVSYAVCATDRRGNEACAKAKSYHVAPASSGTGGGGGAGTSSVASTGSGASDANATGASGCALDSREPRGPTSALLVLAGVLGLAAARHRRARRP